MERTRGSRPAAGDKASVFAAMGLIAPDGRGSLQARLREGLSAAIARGLFAEGEAMPSTRVLAAALGVSRNSVALVYQELVAGGWLVARRRSRFEVATAATRPAGTEWDADRRTETSVDWSTRFAFDTAAFSNVRHPSDWREKRFTFVYGQHDRWVFPISDWRRVSRESLSLHDMYDWTVDYMDADDPLLLDAFRGRVLPRRGLYADEDQVLVTVGAQNALYLVARCLIRPGMVVGIESPCYPDTRNILTSFGAVIRPIPVDDEGLVVGDDLRDCEMIWVTPGHQAPTTVTLSPARRKALLDLAQEEDILIVEDDYDTECRFGVDPLPALKAADEAGRVIYLTSLSKLLSPGLRVGFLVGPSAFIRQARAMRRLCIRHPPANNQRAVALFLKGGHYESLLRRFHADYELRWRTLKDAVRRWLPDVRISPSEGGASLWLKLPDGEDARELARRAYAQDVHIEPGDHHFMGPDRPKSFIRLGFSSIQAEDIDEGIRRLSEVRAGLAAEAAYCGARETSGAADPAVAAGRPGSAAPGRRAAAGRRSEGARALSAELPRSAERGRAVRPA